MKKPIRKSVLEMPGPTTIFSHIPEGCEEGPCETVLIMRDDGMRTIHIFLFLEPFRAVNNGFCRNSIGCNIADGGLCSCAIEDEMRYTARQLNIQHMVAVDPDNTPMASIVRLIEGHGWSQ